jgi:predicted dehydrogenase/threonine dehydrogenase-like Zn-dependent dehydrogenase
MKQIFVSVGGAVEILDVPVPGPLPGSILVQTVRSLISSGTESAAVSKRGGLFGAIEKGLQSPQRIEQVWRMVRQEGVAEAFSKLRRKLDDVSPAGYSSAGVVLEVSGDDVPFRVGDRVACMGAGFANHAEFATVPMKLAHKLPEKASFDEGAFGALACIALQGIRRLELTPGEKIGVIGLGLIGQITVQLLIALGYEAVGFDLDTIRATRARELSGIRAWCLNETDSLVTIGQLTKGTGLDGMIVCAATSSDEPVNLALDLCRQRGRVVIIGDVGLGLDRAKMYRKELELRLSCSYGPGRYDTTYEIAGQDYPIGHVRWTEGRNLELFCELLGRGKLRLRELITDTFTVDQAPVAYATLKQGGASRFAMIFDYGAPPATPLPLDRQLYTRRRTVKPAKAGAVRLGIIGCGAFVRSVHLPELARLSAEFQISGLASRSGASAEALARRYHVPLASSDYRILLDSDEIDAVLVATRHASHARIALDALDAGKHVFVEKPLCVEIRDGKKINTRAVEQNRIVHVGFNRRFAPALMQMRAAFGECPRIVTCRVNLGALGEDWSNTEEEGGRLLGEGVHFFDLCNWFIGAAPSRVSAILMGPPTATNPNCCAQFEYADGSIANVIYTTVGHSAAGKEWFEVIGGGVLGQCDDFRTMSIHGPRARQVKFSQVDKGHRAAWIAFHAAIAHGRETDAADPVAGTWATAMARETVASAARGEKLPFNLSF